MKELEKRKNSLLKNKTLIILIAILILAFAVRLFYFNITKDQAVWWDEADYLLKAKDLVHPIQNYEFLPHRNFGMSLVWAGLSQLGANETFFRFLYVLMSTLTIWIIFLLGKELYNENIGLISSFLFAVFYLHIFYSMRLLLHVPEVLFFTLTLLFFWKGYKYEEKRAFNWIFAGIFSALGLLMFYSTGNSIAIIVIFLLLTEKFKIFKNKSIWKMIGAWFVALSPWFIYNLIKYSNPIKPITATFIRFKFGGLYDPQYSVGLPLPYYLKYFPQGLKIILFVLLIIGLISFIDLILGFDIIFKRKEKKLDADLFVLIWLIEVLLMFGLTGHFEDRYIITIFPAFFIVIGKGIQKIYSFTLDKYKKIAVIILLVLLLIAGYQQLSYANQLTRGMSTSYLQIKQASLWLKENSNPDDIIVVNNNDLLFGYYLGKKLPTFGASDESLTLFLKEKKPKYLVITIFEPVKVDWHYTYPEKHPDLVTPLYGFFADQEQKQAVIGIYKVNVS